MLVPMPNIAGMCCPPFGKRQVGQGHFGQASAERHGS